MWPEHPSRSFRSFPTSMRGCEQKYTTQIILRLHVLKPSSGCRDWNKYKIVTLGAQQNLSSQQVSSSRLKLEFHTLKKYAGQIPKLRSQKDRSLSVGILQIRKENILPPLSRWQEKSGANNRVVFDLSWREDKEREIYISQDRRNFSPELQQYRTIAGRARCSWIFFKNWNTNKVFKNETR